MEVRLSERMEETKEIPGKVELSPLIDELVDVLTPLEGGFSPIVDRLIRLQERVQEDRFQLAVLGQFKRGKSTLLNALLGEEILPTSVLPLTAIPTYISWGKRRGARVFFQDEQFPKCTETDDQIALKEFLAHYVTEKENPENLRVTTRESLDRTLREFKSQLNARFDETLAAAKRKREEAGGVIEEITQLNGIKDRILAVKARLTKVAG